MERVNAGDNVGGDEDKARVYLVDGKIIIFCLRVYFKHIHLTRINVRTTMLISLKNER